MSPARIHVALWCLMALPAAAQWQGELRARRDLSTPNEDSARLQGSRLNPAVPGPERNSSAVEATVQGRWNIFHANLEIREARPDSGARVGQRRVKEMYALVPLGNARISAGRRFVEWDVGFGFRPNDIVQQDTVRYQRRELFGTSPPGRYLVQSEYFWADGSLTVAWVNPHRAGRPVVDGRVRDESALAAMFYQRADNVDFYLFGRYSRYAGTSIGGAFSGVASESASLYGSVRLMQRYDGWVDAAGADAALRTNSPWRQTARGPATQGLVGANWTGESRQSVTVEWWYDGTTLSDPQWRAWQARKAQLAAAGLLSLQGDPSVGPGPAIGANLAWQDLPLSVLNQRRQTVFLRLAWQPDPWTLSLDTVYFPSDQGRVHTAGLQWQGDRLRLDAAYRWFDGPTDALATQLPTTRTGLVALTWLY